MQQELRQHIRNSDMFNKRSREFEVTAVLTYDFKTLFEKLSASYSALISYDVTNELCKQGWVVGYRPTRAGTLPSKRERGQTMQYNDTIDGEWLRGRPERKDV